MGRAIRRAGITIVAACATALAMALPASAKGPVIPIHVTTSVSGPGISAPIVLHWGGDCPFPEFCGSTGNQLDAYSFLDSAGILGRSPGGTGPPVAQLGPKYEITYRAVSRGVVMQAHQDLYPFGPGTSEYDPQRPWIYTLPGQRLFTMVVPGGWIQAPTSLISILRDHGFSVPAPSPGALDDRAGPRSDRRRTAPPTVRRRGRWPSERSRSPPWSRRAPSRAGDGPSDDRWGR